MISFARFPNFGNRAIYFGGKMNYIKINEKMYPAVIDAIMADYTWDNRVSKAITVELEYNEVVQLFQNGVKWSIVTERMVDNEKVNLEQDCSDYVLSGEIIDHRDGRITIKMGQLTDLERAYEMLLGGIE